MKTWLVTIGEPVPVDALSRDRLHRTGAFAQFLAARGHEVVWWTSTFDHFRKTHIAPKDETVDCGNGVRIRLLRGCGYERNVSVARLRDHSQVARKFAAEAALAECPNIVVAALPTVELSLASVNYGLRNDVPVVLDMRDMWPDILLEAAPAIARPIARGLLHPMYRQARRACRHASAITGITDAFVDWGVKRGGRVRSDLDRAFPLGYSATGPAQSEIEAADQFWDAQGVTANGQFTVCYFGGLSHQLDLSHAIDAARQLQQHEVPVRFVLCGSGERLEEYRASAAGLPNVILPGWVDKAAIYSLMRRSSAGLDPLPERFDFLASVNNKAIEYMSAGLPVVSSPLSGVLFNLLSARACGLSYASNDGAGLAKLLARLAQNPAEVQAMGRRSACLFHEQFTAQTVFAGMAEHLERIANR